MFVRCQNAVFLIGDVSALSAQHFTINEQTGEDRYPRHFWRHESSYSTRLRDQKPRKIFDPAHSTEQNTNTHITNIRIANIHIANIHVANIHKPDVYSTKRHNTNNENAKMAPNILHRDLFGIEICHEKQPLTIYHNEETTHEAQRDAPMPTGHVGDFFGLINKVLALPLVLPKSNRTMHMSFKLMHGFDFRSGNAVLVGLRVGQVIRAFESISKEVHETKQPGGSSEFHWGRVQLAEASHGSMVVTVTRGIKAKNSQFVPLVGKDGKPYHIEIEWRVLTTRPGGAVGPEDRQTDALHNTMPKLERLTGPTQPRVKHTVTGPVTSTEQHKSATTMTAAKSLPSDDEEIKIPPTPFTAPGTPKHRPAVVTDAGSPYVPSTAAPNLESTRVKPPNVKRNAAEAFGPEQAEADKSIKQHQFRLRKAEAKLGVASAKLEQTASEVGQEDVAYLRAVFNKAKAVHNVRKAELELREAELGDKKDNECLKLQTRKAKAELEVVKAEGKLMRKLQSQDPQQ